MNLSASVALLMATKSIGIDGTGKLLRKYSGLVPILNSNKFKNIRITQKKETARRLRQINKGMIPKNIIHQI